MFALLEFIFIVGMGVFSTMFTGFVLTILWGWFIVTTFGLPQLSIPAAIGLALISGMLNSKFRKKVESEPKIDYADVIINSFSYKTFNIHKYNLQL